MSRIDRVDKEYKVGRIDRVDKEYKVGRIDRVTRIGLGGGIE